MRILAIGMHNDRHHVYDSSTGEIHNPEDLSRLIVSGEPGVFVGCHLYTPVARLIREFGEMDAWLCQVRGRNQTMMRGTRKVIVGSFLPIYFGFSFRRDQEGVHRSRANARLFQCMDLEDISGLRKVGLMEAVSYARSILSLCEERGVKFSGSRGGLAAKLLKASPHWDKLRTPAPEFINDFGRDLLPGNYYGLGVPKGQEQQHVYYLDQVSAHHTVAASTPVPHPEHLRARGNHWLLAKGIRRPWITERVKLDELFNTYGLIACMVSVRAIPNRIVHLFPPFMHEPGRKLVYLYNNERHYLDGNWATLEYAVAAWTSPHADPAIAEYANWALSARGKGIGRKPLLLAAYGALAQRTDRKSETYFPHRNRGTPTILPHAGPMLEVTRDRTPGSPQPSIINVLARGVIEAETRARSLKMAWQLHELGGKVIAVYVDGIMVQIDQLPFLPHYWQVEAELTRLTFQHPTSFTSDQVTKQPGVPKDSPGRAASRMMRASSKRARELQER